MTGLIYRAVFNGYDKPRPDASEDGVHVTAVNANGRTKAQAIITNRQARMTMDVTGYDWSLYLDGSIHTIQPITPLVESWLEDADMVMFKHPERDCSYKEVKACVGARKMDKRAAASVVDKLKTEGVAPHSGLWATGMICRKEPRPQWVTNVMNRWLELFNEGVKMGCYRDQVWFPLALQQCCGEPSRMKTYNANIFHPEPWFSFHLHGQ